MPIRNPVAFIGEQVLGATAGAPLSADANGQLSSGISNSRVAVAGTILSTTSTTDVVVTGQTLTPAAGTYWAMARAVSSATTNNRTISLSIYSNGVQSADSLVKYFVRNGNGLLGGTSDTGIMVTEAIVTVNGSQAIDMRWNTDGGTGNITNYSLFLLRLS